MFDSVLVGIARSFTKKGVFSYEERQALLERVVKEEGLENVQVETFDCLTVEFARRKDISIMVRGLRAISDFDTEFQMALTNRNMSPDVETVFLMSSQEHFYLSSHLVKEIVSLNGEGKQFVPPFVEEALRQKLTR